MWYIHAHTHPTNQDLIYQKNCDRRAGDVWTKTFVPPDDMEYDHLINKTDILL